MRLALKQSLGLFVSENIFSYRTHSSVEINKYLAMARETPSEGLQMINYEDKPVSEAFKEISF